MRGHNCIVISLLILLVGCQPKSEYQKWIDTELASGERKDSLFFGIYLGMSSQDFYSHCWDLNKKGLIRQGANNTSVYYPITTFEHPTSMDFYPVFHKDKIAEMPIQFGYDAWAPWNKHLWADSLKVEVLGLMEEWYGDGFKEIESPYNHVGNAFVKIEGNRQVVIYNTDETKVKVNISDLSLADEIVE